MVKFNYLFHIVTIKIFVVTRLFNRIFQGDALSID
jgi:hypothetical protein